MPIRIVRGRGTASALQNRYEAWSREPEGVGPESDDPDFPAARIRTQVTPTRARSIIAGNDSPDIPFDHSLNPYGGCEHGCVYCYARPSHAYLGLSPGLEFETRIVAKINAAELLRAELARAGHVCSPLAIGGNTDPYQPAERELRITRSLIEVLAEHRHPFTIITKNALIERDIDLIAPMAAQRLARVYLSVTNWDRELARRLEPRASAPHRRIEAIRALTQAGIPTGVLVAPLIPFITDLHMEEILERAAEAGATDAAYILLRLPKEVAPLFKEWLTAHYPLKAAHVMSLVRQMSGGRDYDGRFGVRQTGTGPHAQLIARRFDIACRRLGLARRRDELDRTQFRRPGEMPQMALF
jgi:DNA repair photolyase